MKLVSIASLLCHIAYAGKLTKDEFWAIFQGEFYTPSSPGKPKRTSEKRSYFIQPYSNNMEDVFRVHVEVDVGTQLE